MWLGETDPVSSIESMQRDDPERAPLQEMLEAWADVIGVGYGTRHTLGEVMAIAKEMTANFQLTHPRLHAAVQSAAARGREPADAQKLAYWMRSRHGTFVDDWRFVNNSKATKSKSTPTYWWIESKAGKNKDGCLGGVSAEERENIYEDNNITSP